MRKQLSHAALVLIAVATLAACTPGGGGAPSSSAPAPGQTDGTGTPSPDTETKTPAPPPSASRRALGPRAGQRRTRDHGQTVRDRHTRELHARLPGRRPCSREPAPRRRRSLPRAEEQRGAAQPRAPAQRTSPAPSSTAARSRPRSPASWTASPVEVELQPARRLRDRRRGMPPRSSLAPPAELSKLQHLPQEDWLPRQAASSSACPALRGPVPRPPVGGQEAPGRGLPLHVLHPETGPADALAPRCRRRALRSRRGGARRLEVLPHARRRRTRRRRAAGGHHGRHGRRRSVRAGPPGGPAVCRDHPRRDGGAARPVRLLRAARMGHGLPAGQVRAPARVPPAAARRRTDRPRWSRRTGSAARTSMPSGSTLRTPCR